MLLFNSIKLIICLLLLIDHKLQVSIQKILILILIPCLKLSRILLILRTIKIVGVGLGIKLFRVGPVGIFMLGRNR